MLSPEIAQRFAEEWIAVWNSHDLDAIMAHYAEDVLFWSPMIAKMMGDPSGKIEGRERLRAYFARGVSPESKLHFTLLQVLTGVESVTIYFRRHDGVEVAEMMVLNADGLATQVRAHYSAASSVWQP